MMFFYNSYFFLRNEKEEKVVKKPLVNIEKECLVRMLQLLPVLVLGLMVVELMVVREVLLMVAMIQQIDQIVITHNKILVDLDQNQHRQGVGVVVRTAVAPTLLLLLISQNQQHHHHQQQVQQIRFVIRLLEEVEPLHHLHHLRQHHKQKEIEIERNINEVILQHMMRMEEESTLERPQMKLIRRKRIAVVMVVVVFFLRDN
jgi:hypothetical protein